MAVEKPPEVVATAPALVLLALLDAIELEEEAALLDALELTLLDDDPATLLVLDELAALLLAADEVATEEFASEEDAAAVPELLLSPPPPPPPPQADSAKPKRDRTKADLISGNARAMTTPCKAQLPIST
ncbi:hypothetical protein GCM10028811_37460 [Uliginosibacterium sediminicola]